MDIRSLGSGVQVGAAPIQPGSQAASQVAGDPGSTSNGTAQVTQSDQTGATGQADPSVGKVQEAVQKINASPAVQAQGIEFSIDNTSHRIVVKVVDSSNNQVIRQIPSKEALAIADSLDESQGGQSPQGLLIKQQA